MKKILIISTLLFAAPLLSGAQDIHFTRLFSEGDVPGSKGSRQGGTVCGDIFFHFRDGNEAAYAYHMPDGEYLGRVPMKEEKTYHNNNVQLSEKRYRKGDEFPLMYASQENAAQHKIVVNRILRDGEGFKCEVVQEILLPSPVQFGVWYTNIILDEPNGRFFITGYSGNSWNKESIGNCLELVEFKLPDPMRKKTVRIRAEEAVSRRTFPFRVATQGACIRGGKIYQVYGVPSYGPCSFVCTDIEKGKILWEVDLFEAGIPFEPESMGFFGDELIVADVKGNVYASGLIIPKE